MIGIVTVIATMALLGTACGEAGGAGGGMYGGGAPSPNGPAADTATIGTADTHLGTVLVDADGHTLYLFEEDTGSSSTCIDGCVTSWPPLVAEGAPTAGEGATGQLGTTTRDDGTDQVTYAGHPLYRYSGDAAPGETNGQGLGEMWFVVAPDGTAITATGMDDPYVRGGYG
jgi:predicted lipoprotein with Yx(FWY)xxD motif